MGVTRSWQKDLPPDDELTAQLKKMAVNIRWAKVRRHTLVKYNGEWTTFGSLSGNEKQDLEFNEMGALEGCDPFYEAPGEK